MIIKSEDVFYNESGLREWMWISQTQTVALCRRSAENEYADILLSLIGGERKQERVIPWIFARCELPFP